MITIHLIVALVITLFNLPLIFNPHFFYQFVYGDLEIAAFIAYLINKGARLYQDFAIVYGPGRFMLLAGLNRLFNVDISIPVTISYQQLMSLIIVPFCLYLTTFSLLEIRKNRLRVVVSIFPSLIYYLFFRSGQDTQVAILLLIISVNWWLKTGQRIAAIAAGLLLTVIGGFRLEALISGLIAISVVIGFNQNRFKNQGWFAAGFFISFFGYLMLIAINGSITNFFHDLIWLGIVNQPQQMKLTIAPVDYPLFEFFFLLALISVLIAFSQNQPGWSLLSFFGFIGFANALGRADFGHLYYSVVLIIPALFVSIYQRIFLQKKLLPLKLNFSTMLFMFIIISLSVLTLKKQSIPILIIFYLLLVIVSRADKINYLLLAFLTSLIAFHTLISSFSLFVFYARKQFYLPLPQAIAASYRQIPQFVSLLQAANYAGLILNQKDLNRLTAIKKDLKDNAVFIYPSHPSLYHALNKKPPVRYLYFNNEYTSKMEEETIRALQTKKINYVLISANLTKPDAIIPVQTLRINRYFEKNYRPQRRYPLAGDQFILLIRKNQNQL